jgi:sulfhydrogenase subunit alpha
MADVWGDAAGERRFDVPVLARVEGEGALHVVVEGSSVTEARLRIYEPPRFFEALLRGRSFTEPIDITSRICGICPVAYQMSAAHALESVCGVVISPEVRELRRLLYCGEWIESHVLHIALLHAPDFLGMHSGIEMASRGYGAQVELALRLKKLGNRILEVIGGRAIHPMNVTLGGFHRAPTVDEIRSLRPELEWGIEAGTALVDWVAGFSMPQLDEDDDQVALVHPDEYPFNEGRLANTNGLTIDVAEFRDHYEEHHEAWSTALHGYQRNGRRYTVGPIARFNLNRERLTPLAAAAAERSGLPAFVRNPFQSIVVRAVETLFACEEALRIVDGYRRPSPPMAPAVAPRAGVGHAITEAPRGILYHRYELDPVGTVLDALIVSPTAQVQPVIEEDLRAFVGANLHLDDTDLQWRCEQVIRNYDPCISCSTHFLRLTVDRRP